MDYFKQRRAFRKLKRDQIDISTGQNNLYRELLDYANDENTLDDLFTLKNSALLDLTGLSEGGLKKARNELVQLELIEYVPGKRNKQKPKYKIVQLYHTSWGTTKGKSNPTSNPHSDSTSNTTKAPTGATKVLTSTNDLDSTNTQHHHNDDDEFKNLLTLYQQNIGATGPIVIENLRYAVDDFKQHDNSEKQATEIVQEAIKIATFNNVHSWKYINTTLMNWQNDSLFTLANIRADQKRRTSKRSGGRRVEVATDWDQAKPDDDSLTDDEKKAETARLQEKLRKMRARRNNEEATS